MVSNYSSVQVGGQNVVGPVGWRALSGLPLVRGGADIVKGALGVHALVTSLVSGDFGGTSVFVAVAVAVTGS